jgi:hypothetical protein
MGQGPEVGRQVLLAALDIKDVLQREGGPSPGAEPVELG